MGNHIYVIIRREQREDIPVELRRGIPFLEERVAKFAKDYKNTAVFSDWCGYDAGLTVIACQGNCKEAPDISPSCLSVGGQEKLTDDSGFPNAYCVKNCGAAVFYNPNTNSVIKSHWVK